VARYDHLQLLRFPSASNAGSTEEAGGAPQRDVDGHSRKLRAELDTAIAEQQRRRRQEFVDPSSFCAFA
jgi:hypothetical protein